MRRRGTHTDSGTSLVEFALILPVLMCLILGVFTGGIAYNRKISMTSAVREGARFGATLKCSQACVSAASWAPQVTQRVVDVSGGELQTSDVCVWLGTATGSDTHCSVSDPSGAVGTMVVKVSATRTANLQALFFTRTLTLSSSTAVRYERSDDYNMP